MNNKFDFTYIEQLMQQSLEDRVSPEDHRLLLLFFKYADEETVDLLIERAFSQKKSNLTIADDKFEAIMAKVGSRTNVRKIKMRTLLRYAAAIILLLCIPILFYKKEIQQAIHYTQVAPTEDISSDSMVVIPKLSPIEKEVRLSLSDSRVKTLDSITSKAEETLADLGVRIVQQYNAISYEAIKETVNLSKVYHEIDVPAGRTFMVQLLDGTKIKVNAGSKLRYPLTAVDGKMLLTLKGEAYFDVAHQDSRKFIVEIPASKNVKRHQIEVLGTQFNIKAYTIQQESKTTLIQGSIQATGLQEESILIKPNEQLLVNQEAHVNPANITAALAWLDNTFYFENTSLEQFCQEIGRWYNVEVVYDKSLEHMKFYVNVSRKQPLSDILTILKANPSIVVKQTDERIYITRQY